MKVDDPLIRLCSLVGRALDYSNGASFGRGAVRILHFLAFCFFLESVSRVLLCCATSRTLCPMNLCKKVSSSMLQLCTRVLAGLQAAGDVITGSL